MARKKSQSLKDTSVHIMRALEDSSEIGGKDFTVEDGGVLMFTHKNGKRCRVKATFINGPRDKSTVDELN